MVVTFGSTVLVHHGPIQSFEVGIWCISKGLRWLQSFEVGIWSRSKVLRWFQRFEVGMTPVCMVRVMGGREEAHWVLTRFSQPQQHWGSKLLPAMLQAAALVALPAALLTAALHCRPRRRPADAAVAAPLKRREVRRQ